MKYILLFCDDGGGHEMDPTQQEAMYAEVGKWWDKNGSKIRGGEELQSASTATTVRGGRVTDGPFMEGKESIGGYAVVEVADLDEALDLAKSWPASPVVEVRPLIERN